MYIHFKVAKRQREGERDFIDVKAAGQISKEWGGSTWEASAERRWPVSL